MQREHQHQVKMEIKCPSLNTGAKRQTEQQINPFTHK